MTRPAGSKLVQGSQTCSLVLDGETVKARLIAERLESNVPVHVDWVRFTCLRRNSPTLPVDDLLPLPGQVETGSLWDEMPRLARLRRMIALVPDCDHGAAAQALDLAADAAACLGSEFVVSHEIRKGHDFYRNRISIEREGQEVGWVGFGASSDSERQQGQARSLHCNLYGAACTFGAPGWRERLADLIDDRDATVTRCDLALDFFEGLYGGMARIVDDYETGLMNKGGRLLKCNQLGDWSKFTQGGRSFYLGSKAVGCQTNFYEKGDQLFGVGVSKWIRAEVRLGNKLRDLPSDLLRRPADFFAGVSDYHAQLLAEAEAEANAERIRCRGRLAAETVEAEVHRNVKHIQTNAAPSIATALAFMGIEDLFELLGTTQRPQRLRRFTTDELRAAYARASTRLNPAEGMAPALA